MQTQFRGPFMAGAALAVAMMGSGVAADAADAGAAEPHNIIEAARATVEDFDGIHFRTEFRANIRRADAVIVLPRSSEASDEGRPAVVVVHDGGRGAWSNPAFYRVRATDGVDAVPDGRVILMVMTIDAVDALTEGSASLGGQDDLSVESITTNVKPRVEINATADVLAFADLQRGRIGPSSFDGWKLTADRSLNQRYYGDGATAEAILSRGTTRTPGVERLVGGLRIARGIDESLD